MAMILTRSALVRLSLIMCKPGEPRKYDDFDRHELNPIAVSFDAFPVAARYFVSSRSEIFSYQTKLFFRTFSLNLTNLNDQNLTQI